MFTDEDAAESQEHLIALGKTKSRVGASLEMAKLLDKLMVKVHQAKCTMLPEQVR